MAETRKKPDPIDIYVGTRIRLRRNILGLTQEKLGEKLGVTFQQIQKYEKGTNRIGASRLQAIAEIMDVPVSYFFDKGLQTQHVEGFTESDNDFIDFCSSNEGIQLMRAFTNISDAKVRRKIIDLAKALSEEEYDKQNVK
ncbi:helix-turn-helix transcriptional regulator [Bartonella acomydis]|uniref:Helix-turn-helix domain-containing protein n=1 Tax=Bartonella acomydis TaxID=686234 RepID=A0ABP9MQB6_9HYPH